MLEKPRFSRLWRSFFRIAGISVLVAAPLAIVPAQVAFAAGNISGTITNDLNNNNAIDAGETPAGGVVVYYDVDNSTTLNTGDVQATTAENGTYTINAAPDGTHNVRIVAPANGSVTVSPAASTVAGANLTGVNGAVHYGGSIAGVAGYSTGQSGGPLEGATISIDRNNDGVKETTTSDASGDWQFDSVPNGIFSITGGEATGFTAPDPLAVTVAAGAAVTGEIVSYTLNSPAGYWEVASDGGVFSYGQAQFYGSMGGKPLNSPIVGLAGNPDEQGYWEVAADGGVFAFGSSQFYGSMGGQHLNSPIVGIAPTFTGQGYLLVAADGGVFAFGDAAFAGSAGSLDLNSPIVGITPDLDGDGYWLVAADGGVFAYRAEFYGSAGDEDLDSEVVGISVDMDGDGYRIVTADGAVYSYEADYQGGANDIDLNAPIVGIDSTNDGVGYLLVAADGGIFGYPEGEESFYGSAGNLTLASPVVGIWSF